MRRERRRAKRDDKFWTCPRRDARRFVEAPGELGTLGAWASPVALSIPLHRAHGVPHALLRPLSGAGRRRSDRRAHAGLLWPRYSRSAPLRAAAAAGGRPCANMRGRRDELKAMMRMEGKRLEHAHLPRVAAYDQGSPARHGQGTPTRIEGEITQPDRSPSPDMARKARLMQSLKGVGPATGTTCLASVAGTRFLHQGAGRPHRRTCSHRRQFGQSLHAPSHIEGAPITVPPVVLHGRRRRNPQRNPKSPTTPPRLKKRGKPAKLVITAVMRKIVIILNAIIRDKPTRQNPKPLDRKDGR